MSETPDETLHLTTDPDADPQSHVDGKVEGTDDSGPGGDAGVGGDDPDAGPGSVPAGAAGDDESSGDQDAEPASEPAGAADPSAGTGQTGP